MIIGLSPHQSSFFEAFRERHDIRGSDVLELGGAMPASLVLDECHVNSWTCLQSVDYAHHRDDNQEPSEVAEHQNYRTVWANAEEFLAQTDETWDFVFSIAAFEHFLYLPHVARLLPRVLRPGGHLFSIFAPIWSGPWGNHFSHPVPERFGSPRNQDNKTWNTQDIFEAPWEHLTLGPTEFLDKYSRKFDSEFAELLTYETYQSPQINRLFFEDYEYLFGRNGMETLIFRGLFKIELVPNYSKDIHESYTKVVRKFHGTKYENFLFSGIQISQMKIL